MLWREMDGCKAMKTIRDNTSACWFRDVCKQGGRIESEIQLFYSVDGQKIPVQRQRKEHHETAELENSYVGIPSLTPWHRCGLLVCTGN